MTSDTYRSTANCAICGRVTEEFFKVEKIPLLTPDNFGSRHKGVFSNADLTLCYCDECSNIQLKEIVSTDILYKNFRYETKRTHGLSSHFKSLAENILNQGNSKKGFVVDIGSNDGTLLSHFLKYARVLGVEPSEYCVNLAKSRGIDTLNVFFSSQVSSEILEAYGKADIIFCANTLANVPDLHDFVAGISLLLDERGVCVIETQNGHAVLQNFMIDTIYHEHLYYFSSSALIKLFKIHGLHPSSIQAHDQKGGSIRAIFTKGKSSFRETASDIKIYGELLDQFLVRDSEMRLSFERWRESNKSFLGYGASVGTLTQIRYFEMEDCIKTIVDDNPLCPEIVGSKPIPVISTVPFFEAEKNTKSNDGIFLFAYRYIDAIIDKHPDFARMLKRRLFSPFLNGR